MQKNYKVPQPKEIVDVGRPSKFTPERREAIIDAIRNRVPYEFAAEANGIVESTLFDWLNTGRAHQAQGIDSDYTEFRQAIKLAEMTRIRQHSDMIACKPERWQADAWLLERRWYKHYGANAQINELNKRLATIEQAETKPEEEPK